MDEIERVERESPVGILKVKAALRPSVWCPPMEIRFFTVNQSAARIAVHAEQGLLRLSAYEIASDYLQVLSAHRLYGSISSVKELPRRQGNACGLQHVSF